MEGGAGKVSARHARGARASPRRSWPITGRCCSTSPAAAATDPRRCYPVGGFLIGDQDVLLARSAGRRLYRECVPSAAGRGRIPTLIIDVVPGRGGMFSLDNGRERRFLTRSTLCALPVPPAGGD